MLLNLLFHFMNRKMDLLDVAGAILDGTVDIPDFTVAKIDVNVVFLSQADIGARTGAN